MKRILHLQKWRPPTSNHMEGLKVAIPDPFMSSGVLADKSTTTSKE
jgi:hypothetical protein